MFAVYYRELSSYFTTPIGYVFAAMFIAFSGLAFCVTTLLVYSSDVFGYFQYLVLILAVLLPLLTMKSFSEERKTKTEQLLLTSPVSLFSIVFGKFLAAVTVLFVSICINSYCFVILSKYGTVNGTVVFGNIVAIFLIGVAFISAGLFVSAFTENQFVAADAAIGINGFLLGMYFVAPKINTTWLRVVIKWFSFYDRLYPFFQGFFDIGSVVYYFSFSVIFLFLTVRLYESRRWA